MKSYRIVAAVIIVVESVLIPSLLWNPAELHGESDVIKPAEEPPRPPVVDVKDEIVRAASKHGIDSDRFLATAICESGLDPDAVGDHGQSFGLFQIHLPSHPDVSAASATDPIWAIEWSAQKFKINPTIWTCYRNLYL